MFSHLPAGFRAKRGEEVGGHEAAAQEAGRADLQDAAEGRRRKAELGPGHGRHLRIGHALLQVGDSKSRRVL